MKQGNDQTVNIMEEDIRQVLASSLPWANFHNTAVLVTGGNGMLPSFLALTLLRYHRDRADCNLEIFVLARNEETARRIYHAYWGEPYFHFINADVCVRLPITYSFDYVIHGASPADPRRFEQDPASVFLPNTLGTYNLLESARSGGRAAQVLFMSSGEVYGRFAEDISTIRENDFGCVDPLDSRSCYAEGKRAGEALCKIWAEQYGVPAKIVRISHTFGPTINIYQDSRSFAEFVRNVVERKDIQMKSDGSAVRPFCYISDCAEGMLRILLLGKSGQAYNLAGDEYLSILELAQMLSGMFPERHLRVLRTIQDAKNIRLKTDKRPGLRVDTNQLKMLGWRPKVSVAEGFRRTILSIEAEKNGK